MKEFACIFIQHFSLLVEINHNPELAARPIILTSAQKHVVIDTLNIDEEISGAPLSAARSNYPYAIVVEEEGAKYKKEWEGILFTLAQNGIVVEDEAIGIAYAHTEYQGASFGNTLLGLIPNCFPAKIGIAPGKFPAFVAASTSTREISKLDPASIAAFLAPQTINLLPLSWKDKSKLHNFGLRTLGSISSLPLGPFQSQFGRTGREIWELAQGIDTRLLCSKRFSPEITTHASFDSPLNSLQWIGASINALLTRLFKRPSMRGLQARSCDLTFTLASGSVWHKKMVFHKAINAQSKNLDLIVSSLAQTPPPEPVEGIFIALREVSGSSGHQGSLLIGSRNRLNLGENLGQLSARLNTESPLWKIKEIEPWSRIPERRLALVPYAP